MNFSPGIALLAAVLTFLVAAFLAAYFRKRPPLTPLDQLTLIANDRPGWTAQALLFPVVFLATTLVFAWLTVGLPSGLPQVLGAVATLLFAAGTFLWLPISLKRLRFWRTAVELLANSAAGSPPVIDLNYPTFWSHTICVLSAVGLMSVALALAGMLPLLGLLLGGLSLASIVIGTVVWRDWPPFMSYLLLLVLAIGLLQ